PFRYADAITGPRRGQFAQHVRVRFRFGDRTDGSRGDESAATDAPPSGCRPAPAADVPARTMIDPGIRARVGARRATSAVGAPGAPVGRAQPPRGALVGADLVPDR